MAGSLATINIKFRTDLTGFSTQMQNAGRRMKGFNGNLKKVGAGLTAGLTVPLLGLGAAATSVFGDFEQEMAKVKAVSGATESEFKALEKDAKKLGETTRFTAAQVATLQLNFSKLGFNPDQILNATKATLDLALATGEDLATSATVAASTLRGFGLEADETQRVVDVMAASFSGSALNLDKFRTAMAVVAPVAKSANIGLEQTTGLLAVLVNNGIDASSAGTGLRNILLRVAKSGGTLNGELAKITNSTNKNATAMQLFGTKGATVATVLAANTKKSKEFSTAFNNASGSAAEMAAIMDNTLQGSFLRLKSSVEGAFLSIGEVIAPQIRKITKGLTEMFAKFNELSPTTKKWVVAIGGVAAAIGPVVVGLGVLLSNISTVSVAIKALTVVIAANPIGALAIGITAVATAALLAFSRFTELTDATKEFNDLTKASTQSIAAEKAQLEKYIKTAKDDSKSKEERTAAIQQLNKLSPKYLGNLSLENIHTKQATAATKDYVSALLKKAKLLAAEEKLVAVQKKLLDLQLGNLDAVKPGLWQNIGNIMLSFGNASQFASLSTRSLGKNLSEEKNELIKLQNALVGFIDKNKEGEQSTDKLKKAIVDFSNSAANVNVGVSAKDTDLVDLQNNLDSFADLDQLVLFDLTSQESQVAAFFDGMKNRYDEFIATTDENLVDPFAERAERLAELSQAVGSNVAGAFESMAGRFVSSLQLADTGFQGFIKSLAQTVTKLISMMLAQSLSQSIAGATASGAATGPAAVFTTPGFIATAIGGVLAAFATLPKFNYGGVVGGSSYYGDKILARVNSGELILNQDQQRSLYSQLGTAAEDVIVRQEQLVQGENLLLITERAKRKRNRLG